MHIKGFASVTRSKNSKKTILFLVANTCTLLILLINSVNWITRQWPFYSYEFPESFNYIEHMLIMFLF
jgi:hypothetical protein